MGSDWGGGSASDPPCSTSDRQGSKDPEGSFDRPAASKQTGMPGRADLCMECVNAASIANLEARERKGKQGFPEGMQPGVAGG